MAIFRTLHQEIKLWPLSSLDWSSFSVLWRSWSRYFGLLLALFMVRQLLPGQSLLTIEASWLHSVIHNTLGRTSLDEWSVRHRELYLTTHKTYKRQTSMPPAAFEATIPAKERPQTHALDRAATGIGWSSYVYRYIICGLLTFLEINNAFWHTCCVCVSVWVYVQCLPLCS